MKQYHIEGYTENKIIVDWIEDEHHLTRYRLIIIESTNFPEAEAALINLSREQLVQLRDNIQLSLEATTE